MAQQRPPEAHDLLIIPKLRPENAGAADTPSGLLRLSVKQDGHFEESTPLSVQDKGGRKAYNIARPGQGYGPAFAVLPIRPEPGTQSDTCYLINTENMFLPNPWTAADWDVLPPEGVEGAAATQGGEPPADPDAARWRPDGFDLLVAGPRGKVFRVQCDGSLGTVTPIDLKHETDIWSQLREGLIVGTTKTSHGEVLPIVNVTGLDTKEGVEP